MDKKYLIIGGGVTAVLLGGFLLLRSKSQAQEEQQENQQPEAPMMFMSGSIPSSPGMSSATLPNGGGSADFTNNAGSGGGFDISSLGTMLADAVKGQTANAASQIKSNEHTSTSAVLAGINFGSTGGYASVGHTDAGTTLTVVKNDPYEQALQNLYRENFGRNADTAGLAFWKNSLMNGNVSLQEVDKQMEKSDEFTAKQKKAA